jgi:hypothetical protein
MALITYSGEVPISPKTIPRVIKAPASVNLLTWLCVDDAIVERGKLPQLFDQKNGSKISVALASKVEFC